MPPSSRLFWPDLLRAVAICLVLGVHISGAVLNAGYYASGHFSWWLAAAINCVGRCGVPLFFMSSGAILIGKMRGESTGAFLKKRMGRIVVPFFAWSAAYLVLRACRGQVHLSIPAFLDIFREPVYYHLWFFYSIIGLYLITPLFKSADRSVMRYVVLFWLLAVPCTFACSRVFHFSLNGNFQGILPTYIGYFLGGYLLKDTLLKKNLVRVFCAVFVLSSALSVAGTGLLTIGRNGTIDGFFLDYLNLNMLAMSVSLFCLLRSLGEKSPALRFKKPLQITSTCCLGIFAVHPMLLELFNGGTLGFSLSAFTITPLAGIPLTFAAIMAASLGITWLLHKTPLLQNVV
jgi:surface polysaccharide O-acyltransferase-like enzyme